MEAEFSARLFLALAQENDLATDRLDDDLNRFKALENILLDTLKDADEAGFNRQAFGASIWRDDPGAKLTGQRVRAWAALAAADAVPPELLITTSPAVIDTLLDTHGEALHFERLADIRLVIPPAGKTPVLGKMLVDLANRESLPSADLSCFAAPATDAVSESAATVTLFCAANQAPATVLRRLAPASLAPVGENETPKSVCRTLILLVKS